MKLEGDVKKIEELAESLDDAVQYILMKVGQNVLVNNAKINSPYRSGDLKGSIGMDYTMLENYYIIVGSDKPYARIREYINELHPTTKYYLRRAYSEHIPEIKKTIITSLSKKLK